MMILATLMLSAFIIHSVLMEDVDDDGPPDGGMMTPVYAPNPV
jgi:hypothetical protein|tara:strand:+ start:349 stop:477 length:129 start_codon:yes stop_codon:yes gene_type:complete